MTRVLVTGGGGQLGRELALQLGADAVAPGRAELDVTDAASVARAIAEHAPELVLHTAAWTDVDGAESDPEGARLANEEGSRNVARAARAAGAGLVGFSTDYVFAGNDPEGYDEGSPTGPRSVYGATKLAGERALLAEHPEAHVVRTAWVFSPRGRNFLLTMLQARRRARRAARRRRPDRLPDGDDAPRARDARAGRALPAGHLPPGRRRLDELARLRERDHAGRRPRRPRRADSVERAAAAGAAAGLLDPANRARRRATAATLERGAARLSRRPCQRGGNVRRILVTGGCGFIGSHFVRRLLERHDDVEVVNLDMLTYAGNPANLADVAGSERYTFVHGSICDADAVARAAEGCEAIVNFAAETHVDRSIMEAGDFIQTDVFGTYLLLEWIRDRGGRLIHVSTDEVYGDIEEGYASREEDALRPSSPYSASKAGGDLQVLAAVRTYGVDAAITRGSNNYGPNQYPEKLIPLFTTNLLDGEPVPVYGDGRQSRDFIYVEDHCAGIETVLERGASGEIYNVGGGNEIENITTTTRLLELTGRDESHIRYVTDRPGHDRRYALDTSKLQGLGWKPEVTFDEGLQRTVEWYRDNRGWWEPIKAGGGFAEYRRKQYGTAGS